VMYKSRAAELGLFYFPNGRLLPVHH